jgi:hypothetical protein
MGLVCRSKRIVSKLSLCRSPCASGSDGVEIKRVFWPEQKILFVLQRHVSLLKCWSRSDGAREWHFFFVVGQEVYQHARFVGRVKCSSRYGPAVVWISELECGGGGGFTISFHSLLVSNWAQSDREKVHRPRMHVINCAPLTQRVFKKENVCSPPPPL